MSIVAAKEIPGRSGTIGEDSTRSFIFYSDRDTDNERDVYFHRMCPRIGSQHPNSRFGLFYLKRGDLTITQGTGRSEKRKWMAVAKYTQLAPGEDPPEEQPDATDGGESEEPDFQPQTTVEFEDFSAPIDLGINVNQGDSESQFDDTVAAGFGAYPVVNSAMEPYETPPEIFKQNIIIRTTRNVALSSSLWKDAYKLRNTINTDKFSYRHGTAKIDVLANQCRVKIRFGEIEQYKSKTGKLRQYANLEVQFIVKRETWNIDILDFGTVELDTAGKTISQRIADDDWGIASGVEQVPITDKNENRVQGLLDGTGVKLTNGDAAVFNRYPGYFKKKQASFFKRITKRNPPKRK